MPPRHERSRARRARILDAAVEIVIERGLADTPIADLAERAGGAPRRSSTTVAPRPAALADQEEAGA